MERLVEVESVSFEEDNSEVSLRPSNWDDYIGQEKIKKNLKVFIDASKKRKAFGLFLHEARGSEELARFLFLYFI